MPLPRHDAVLHRRQSGTSSTGSMVAFAAVAGITAAILAGIVLIVLFRRARVRRIHSKDPPKWLPKFLHGRWDNWTPSAPYNQLPRPTQSGMALEARQARLAGSASESASVSINEGDIDRRQSVRSILTLPPYRVAPLPSEQLIAREGERAGVDVVVDFPESEAEIEARREEEMSALHRIRETRRREESEREERRAQRRAAREAGDVGLIERLEAERRERAAQRAADERTLETALAHAERDGETDRGPSSRRLIAELGALRESHAHSRRVSAVSYADLGLARHDGSRLRADSVDSRDDRPLLDGAASMGGNRSRAVSVTGSDDGDRGRASSATRSIAGYSHQRNRSDGQLSHHTTGSGQGTAQGDGPRRPSGPRLLSPDLIITSPPSLPPQLPPSYEDDLSVHGGDAPPYESPVETRPPRHTAAFNDHSQDPEHSHHPHQTTPDTPDHDLTAAADTAATYLAQRDHAARDEDEDEWEVVHGGPVQSPTMPPPPGLVVSPTSPPSHASSPTSAKKLPHAALTRIRTNDPPAPAVEVTSATPTSATSPAMRR